MDRFSVNVEIANPLRVPFQETRSERKMGDYFIEKTIPGISRVCVSPGHFTRTSLKK